MPEFDPVDSEKRAMRLNILGIIAEKKPWAVMPDSSYQFICVSFTFYS